ncbi:MAG: SAF domain-containing protein [Anaerolineales bacterium]
MKARGLIFALAGIILVGIGVFAVSFILRQTAASTAVQPTPVPPLVTKVVITTHDMFLGEIIGEEDVTLSEIPAEYVPRDAITSIDEVLNKFIKTDLVQGEMVLQHNIANPTNINSDLAFILSKEHVLFAFPAEDLMSQNAIIQRGDIVDILATMISELRRAPAEGEPALPEGEQILEERLLTIDAYQATDITALVADIIVDENAPEPPPNTPPSRGQLRVKAYLLAIPPQDALLLKYLIDSDAKFDFVVRAPTNRDKYELTPITKEYITELYGLQILP